MQKTMGPAEWGMLLVLSLVWGGSFFFISVAVKELPTFTVMLLRVSIAALVLNCGLAVMGQHLPRDRRVWLAFFGMGLLNNVVPQSLIVWGETEISSGLASILNATTPMFGVLVAHFFTTDERMTRGKIAGILIGFVGVAIMIGPSALGGLGNHVWAQVGIVLAAFFYGMSGVFGRRFKELGVQPAMTATGQLTASTIMMVPLAFAFDHPWNLAMPSFEAWASILGLALLSTVFAYLLFFRILASAGATNLSLVTFLIPVSAVFLGWLFLNEHLEAKHVIGMACIAAGLAAIDGRLIQRFTRPNTP